MGYWSIGKIPLDREAIICMSSLFKPIFQYSNIPSRLHEICSIKNTVISISCRNFETFNYLSYIKLGLISGTVYTK